MVVSDRRAVVEGSFRAAVEEELHRLLPRGKGSIEDLALALGVPAGSLMRCLSEEGMNFSELRDELRRSLSLRYLTRSQLSVDQIALLIGYAEAGAFIRAFRRWSGITPAHAHNHPELLQRLIAGAQTPQRAPKHRRKRAAMFTT